MHLSLVLGLFVKLFNVLVRVHSGLALVLQAYEGETSPVKLFIHVSIRGIRVERLQVAIRSLRAAIHLPAPTERQRSSFVAQVCASPSRLARALASGLSRLTLVDG